MPRKDALAIIDAIDFSGQDDIFAAAQAYEDALRRLGNENRIAGEFYTPRPVIRLIVELVAPQPGATVYDPAAGSGGFLAQAFAYMRERSPRRTAAQDEQLRTASLFGSEKKATPALLAWMNLALHGVSAPHIRRRNALEGDVTSAPAERFDVVLANPPFGGVESRRIQANVPVPSSALNCSSCNTS